MSTSYLAEFPLERIEKKDINSTIICLRHIMQHYKEDITIKCILQYCAMCNSTGSNAEVLSICLILEKTIQKVFRASKGIIRYYSDHSVNSYSVYSQTHASL